MTKPLKLAKDEGLKVEEAKMMLSAQVSDVNRILREANCKRRLLTWEEQAQIIALYTATCSEAISILGTVRAIAE